MEEETLASTFFGSVCAQRGFSLLFSQKSDTHFTSHQPPGLGVGDEGGGLLRSQHKPDPSGGRCAFVSFIHHIKRHK